MTLINSTCTLGDLSDRRAVYEYRNDDVPPRTLVLDGAEAVAVIAHPVRSKALTHLGSPRSVKELAEALDCPASRLYHHVKKLADAGLIEVVAGRRAGSNTERLYQVAARRIEVAGPGPLRDEDTALDVFESASTAAEDLTRSVAADELAVLASAVVSLEHEEAIEVARRLVAVVEEVAALRRRAPRAGGRSHVVQIVVSRTERSPGSHVVASSVEGLGPSRSVLRPGPSTKRRRAR